MNNRISFVLLFALCALLFAGAVDAGSKKKKAPVVNLLESVNVQTSGKFTKVIIQSREPLQYKDIKREDGVYVYMSEDTECAQSPLQKVTEGLVEEVRYGYKGAKSPGDKPIPLDYIFLKLRQSAGYSIQQKEWILVVELKPQRRARIQKGEVGLADDFEPHVPKNKTKQSAVLPETPGLADFLEVAESNYEPLRLAQEEYGLAKFRQFEAARGLFPSVQGKYEISKGTLLKDPEIAHDDVKFRRKEAGVQVGQPIFHSGRLFYSLRQAKMQKHMSAQKVRKARADLVFDVVRAYHNLIKSQKVLKARRSLQNRTDKVVRLARKKRQLDLITQAELLNVESQYSQAYYKLLSEEKDLEISRLKMEALLNSPEPMPEVLPDPKEVFDPKDLMDLDMPVQALVEWGLTNRPDMLSANYTALFHTYGEKVSKAEGRLRVDMSGFLGRAGGAFEKDSSTAAAGGFEPIQLRSSWNVGIQATWMFGGNSIRGSATKDRMSPDYGETTATETRAQTASVSLLDGLKNIADRRQARIAKERAINDQEQMRRTVNMEVREAYYNIQKAKIQIKGAVQELDYRRKELKISRHKERMNLIEPSQSMAAEVAYGEAVNGYEEAEAFYKVSLASLEKALGTPLEAIKHLK